MNEAPAILKWVWQSTLAASLLMVAVSFTAPLFRSAPRWQYRLWFLVIARLLLPFQPESPTSYWHLFPLPDQPATLSIMSGQADAVIASQLPPLNVRSAESLTVWDILLTIWLGGAIFCFGGVLLTHCRFRRSLSRAIPCSAEVTAAVQRAAKALSLRLPTNLRVIETDSVTAPALFGVFHPTLLLPAKTGSFSAGELYAAIVHELIHLKRRDVLLNWFFITAQSLHWFNPLVWWSLRRLKRAREMACDAATLAVLPAEEHRVYGAALLKAASSIPLGTPAIVSIVTSKTQIQERIVMIAKYNPDTNRRRFWPALLILALALVTYTKATEERPSKAPPTDIAPSPAPAIRREALMEELDRTRANLQSKRHELNAQQERLKLSDAELNASQEAEASRQSLHRLTALRHEAKADLEKIASLYQQLTNASMNDLRKAVATAAPDELFNQLSSSEALTEQKITEALDSYGENHPEVRKLKRVQEKIETQLKERVSAIVLGLKVKMNAERSRLQALEDELAQWKRQQIEQSIQSRPLRDLQREINQLEQHSDALRKRLLEKVD